MNAIKLDSTKKAKILDTHQKKVNWRLFAKNGQIVDFPDIRPIYEKPLFRSNTSALDLINYIRLGKFTAYGVGSAWRLNIELKIDQFSFAKMKKAENQARPKATRLSDWLGGALIDIGNYFYRSYNLPYRVPTINTLIRSKDGIKTIVISYEFICNSNSYLDISQFDRNMHEISNKIDILKQSLKKTG